MAFIDMTARYATPNKMGAVEYIEEGDEIVTIISGLQAARIMANIIQGYADDVAGNQKQWNTTVDISPNYDWRNWPD